MYLSSFITELELLGFRNITVPEEDKIKELLNDCSIIPLNNIIKENYIKLRRKYNLKLADSIIAATALVYDMPLITADKQFKNITELKLTTYQHDITLAKRNKL